MTTIATIAVIALVFLIASIPLASLLGHHLRRHQPPPPAPLHPRTITVLDQTGEQVDQTVFTDR